jgi:eukaryotic-like serine/threonine-protein kinase
VAKTTKNLLIGVTIAIAVVAGLSVLLGVFLARRPATVPDIRQLPVAEAEQALTDARLSLGAQSRVATVTLGAGRVLSQSPAPGEQATRRSSVDVTVSAKPEYLPLPNVVGRDAAVALQTLSDALYPTQQVDVFDAEKDAGIVLGQFPPARTTWMTGRPVALAVSVGPDDGSGVRVPNTSGQSPLQAKATLERAGLLGVGFLVNVNTPDANVVTSQLPSAGVRVRPGTTVLLLLQTR